jgi:Glycosyltransferase
MPRVLRVITRMNVGGPATHVILADRGLAARGWETLLIHGTVEPDEREVDLSEAGVPLCRVPALARPIRPASDAQAFAAIAREIRRFRPDIVHTHLSKAGLLGRFASMATSRAARVHTFHGTVFGGYFGERSSAAIVRAERFLGARSARVIALSDRQRAELTEFRIAPVDRIRIVPLGLDLGRFRVGSRADARAALGVEPGDIVVLAVGRIVPIKRLDRLIRAFASVYAVRQEVRLYLVGDGSERPCLEAMVRDLGIEAVVRFVGWSTQTPVWYAASDIVALSSDREGTPLALIEAACAGRPVVAVAVGGVADVVADGVTGFVVPPSDEAAFADALGRLVADSDLRRRFGEAAPEHAAGYDSARLVDDLDRLYREVLSERVTGG